MIFAREVNDPLTGLVKKMEAAATELKDRRLDTFVVFCSDDKELEAKLKSLVEKEAIANSAVSLSDSAGPKGFKVPREAEVAVVLYVRRIAQAAFTFRKGELTEQDADRIVAAIDGKTETPFPIGYVAPAYAPKRPITVNGFGADKAARGPHPNILMFARDMSAPLTTLARRVDEVARDQANKVDSFVVLLGESAELEGKLKELALNQQLRNTTLSVEPAARGRAFHVSRTSDITVLISANGAARGYYTFKLRDFNTEACDKLLAELAKILQEEKAKEKKRAGL